MLSSEETHDPKSMTPTAHFLPPEMRTWGAGRLADLGLEKEEQKMFNSES